MTTKMTRVVAVALPLVVSRAALADDGPDWDSVGIGVTASADGTANVTPVIKTVALANEVELQYIEQGDSSGIPVLLLHGYTDSWHSFELVLPYLPNSVRAFALSQRGHGDSDRPASGYHPRDFAADAVAFMDALELERAIIVGHSMGSYVAQAFAISYPERTLGLVLVGSFTTLQGDAGIQEFWDTAISKLEDPVDPIFALEFQKSTLALPVPPAFLDTVVRESLKVPAYVWKAACQALMETDLSGELGKISAPTLIVWGDRDAYFPRHHQDALAAAIKGSHLIVYQGVGHGVHWEAPARFAADLEKFIETRLNHKP
jgi:pimeloyl-ACP methyl ester carboxylesterase